MLRRYLLLADGMAVAGALGFDKHGFLFWPLREWTTAAQELRDQGEEFVEEWLEKALVFADYMTRSWSYAIYLGQEIVGRHGAIFRIGSPGAAECAPSFEAFVRLYIDNSRRLYGE
jgi:hypothetical protein